MMEFYCSQDRTLRGGDIWAGVWVIRRDKMWEFWRKSFQEEKFEGCHGKLCSPYIAQMHLARGRRRVRHLVQSCAVRFDAASSRRIAGFCLFSIYLFIFIFPFFSSKGCPFCQAMYLSGLCPLGGVYEFVLLCFKWGKEKTKTKNCRLAMALSELGN